jgi:hypothetical protein
MLQEKVSRGKDRVDVKKYDAAVDPSGETDSCQPTRSIFSKNCQFVSGSAVDI